VLAHNPFAEQAVALRKLRSLLRDGGHVIALENISEQAAHVFSNPPDGWIGAFERAGFKLLAQRPYDYSPATRGLAVMRRLGRRALLNGAAGATPEGLMTSNGSSGGRLARWREANFVAQDLAARIDERIEPELVKRAPNMTAVHCGFLFEAVAQSTF
jgi:hypothetical protein